MRDEQTFVRKCESGFGARLEAACGQEHARGERGRVEEANVSQTMVEGDEVASDKRGLSDRGAALLCVLRSVTITRVLFEKSMGFSVGTNIFFL